MNAKYVSWFGLYSGVAFVAGVGLTLAALRTTVGKDGPGSQPDPYAAYAGWSATGFAPATQPAKQPMVNADYTVMADKTTGGFKAEVHSTTYMTLRWSAVPGATGYSVFYGTKPKILLNSMESLLTNLADQPEWSENGCAPGTQYYFVVCAATPAKTIVIATGSAKTPAVDGPLTVESQPATRP